MGRTSTRHGRALFRPACTGPLFPLTPGTGRNPRRRAGPLIRCNWRKAPKAMRVARRRRNSWFPAADRLSGWFTRPAHPGDGSLGVVAKFLGHPLGATARAQYACSYGLLELSGAGLATVLRRDEQGIGPDGPDAGIVHRWLRRETCPLGGSASYRPGVPAFAPISAERPSQLVIHADCQAPVAPGSQATGFPWLKRSHWQSGPAAAILRRKVFRLRSAGAPRHPLVPGGAAPCRLTLEGVTAGQGTSGRLPDPSGTGLRAVSHTAPLRPSR